MQKYNYHDFFAVIKEALDMKGVADHYGLAVNRSGFILCPFHTEKTASCKLYSKRFRCYGCGEHGSVIDFTAKLFGLGIVDACKKLNQDFHLGLSIGRPPTPAEQEELKARRYITESRLLFQDWRNKTLKELDNAIRVGHLADMKRLSSADITAIRYHETFEYWNDILLHASLDEQMQVFRDRKEVEWLCQTVLNHTPEKYTTD